MRHKVTGIAIILVCLSMQQFSYAQAPTVNLGVNWLFMSTNTNITLKNTDISLLDAQRFTNYELYGAIYVRNASLRGYYQPHKSFNSDIVLPESFSKDKKALPVTSVFTVSNSRLELGIPIRFNYFSLLEPMLVYQSLGTSVSLTGKDYTHESGKRFDFFCLGVVVTENINRYSTLYVKFYAGNETSMFDIRYLLRGRPGFIGIGYRQHRLVTPDITIRTSGPILEAGLVF